MFTIASELLPQRRQRAVQVTLDGVFRYADDPPNFGGAELFLIAQRENEALQIRKRGDQPSQSTRHKWIDEPRRHCKLVIVEIHSPRAAPPQLVDAFLRGDLTKPVQQLRR